MRYFGALEVTPFAHDLIDSQRHGRQLTVIKNV
jgi:hypothetical protein